MKYWKVIFNINVKDGDFYKMTTEIVVISEEIEAVLARTKQDLYEKDNQHWIVYIREIDEHEYKATKPMNGNTNSQNHIKLQERDLV